MNNRTKDQSLSQITRDPWQRLKSFTEARIALGRAGTSLPLSESLAFRLAHARARDAVQCPADLTALAGQLDKHGRTVLKLASRAENRAEYLTRPDKGRTPDDNARATLKPYAGCYDLCIVVCDGLSAPAIHENALPVVDEFTRLLAGTHFTLAPICLVENGRVAIGDHIGAILGCSMVIVLIGERPGLSSPNSLGAYLTLNPRPGTTDEARNCVSNIRNGGMSHHDAARKIAYLVEHGMKLGKTGVELKDMMGAEYVPFLTDQTTI